MAVTIAVSRNHAGRCTDVQLALGQRARSPPPVNYIKPQPLAKTTTMTMHWISLCYSVQLLEPQPVHETLIGLYVSEDGEKKILYFI